MNDHFRDYRKIDPTRGATLDDGSPNDNDRVEIGPTQLAFREWEDAGLQPPNLARMRAYRWRRMSITIVMQRIVPSSKGLRTRIGSKAASTAPRPPPKRVGTRIGPMAARSRLSCLS